MFMTSKLLADRQGTEETVKVLVARKHLDTAQILKKPEDFLEEKEVPKETAPKNALTKFEEAKGRQLKIPRRQGDTITQDDLHDNNGNTMMQLLPKGYRAVGIRVSSEMIAAGFAAVPHSRIDIACTVRGNAGDKDNGSRIFLQNVLVLASGTETVRGPEGKAMACEVVTVALTPDDALELEAARNRGALSMYLRPFGEGGHVETGTHVYDGSRKAKGGSSAREEEEPAPKQKSVLNELPVNIAAQVKLIEHASVKPIRQAIKSGQILEIWEYVLKEDGTGWESKKIEAQPENSVAAPSVSSASAAPGPRSAQRPSTAATTPGTTPTPNVTPATPGTTPVTPGTTTPDQKR
jgi:Flp pilus assembly protein CpaB